VEMDATGIDVAVLYPTTGLFFGPTDPIEALRNAEFVRDCQRAYNDWLADYCKEAPDRLFGVAAVPLQDIDLAIGEAQRAVGDLGMKGVFIRPSPYIDNLPLSNPVYDPFWAACQELQVPVSLHPAVHVDTPGACRMFDLIANDSNINFANSVTTPEHGGSALGQAVGNPVDMIVSLGRLLMGGICERFPGLTFVLLESGGGWLATQLERMDEQVGAFKLARRWLSMLPSEYFRRQCYVSFDPGEWNLASSAEHLGADRILWASDYPHPEYHRDVVDELRASIASLPAPDQAKIEGQNAARVYNLPVPVPG
ncbi:MAG: amidohydrolase family protein, partial [Acidimicrobiia bacterium]